jgi:hypothetical protein
VRHKAVDGKDTDTRLPPVRARRVDVSEAVLTLTEKVKILRQEYLIHRIETAKLAASLANKELTHIRRSSARWWKALSRTDVATCPQCRVGLRPFPPESGLLFVCTRCGFVARPVARPAAK